MEKSEIIKHFLILGGLRWRSRYIDRLRVGRSGDRIPVRARFPATVQTSVWPNQPPIQWVPIDHPPHLDPRLKKEYIYVYTYTPPVHSWKVIGWTLSYLSSPITHKHVTPGRTPLDEWSARRTDLYLTTHNTHTRHTFGSRQGRGYY
jgi:hypothetical protein